MTDQLHDGPERADLAQRQAAFRALIESNVGEEPSNGVFSQHLIEGFGLDPNEYDIYVGGAGSGLCKLVSRTNPQDVRVGVHWNHIGGPTNAPDLYIKYGLMLPNGDLALREVKESRGSAPTLTDYYRSASDPDQRQRYETDLGVFNKRAKEYLETPKPPSEGVVRRFARWVLRRG